MNYEVKVFKNQYPNVHRFALHLTCSRVLRRQCQTYGLDHDPFWVMTIDAHVLRAAIRWCNVFGADDTSDIHWKKLSALDRTSLENTFRNGVLKATNLDWAAWQTYWQEFTDFRNKYAAHADLEFKGKVPNFDIALNVAYFYDQWVRDEVVEPHSMDSNLPLVDVINGYEKDLAMKLSALFTSGRNRVEP
ncbi:MAG: hypothetical protein WCC11_08135 [Gammaproteobacteria bacterium]